MISGLSQVDHVSDPDPLIQTGATGKLVQIKFPNSIIFFMLVQELKKNNYCDFKEFTAKNNKT